MADDVKKEEAKDLQPAAPAQAAPAAEAQAAKALKGKVKWFDDLRGYGFVHSEKGEDVFVHFSQLQGEGYRTLKADEPVSFVIGKGKNGPEAQQVARLAAPPALTPEQQALAEKRQLNKQAKKEGPATAAAAAKPAKKAPPKK